MSPAVIAWGLALVGLLVYEFWALATGRELLTTAVRRASLKTHLVPFLTGFLMGHFFWGC